MHTELQPSIPSRAVAGRRSAALCCVLAVTLAAGCGHSAPSAPQTKKGPPKLGPPLKTAVVTVQQQTWPTIVRCQGSLVADDQTVIGSRVAGLVAETFVDIGDAVEPGQRLVSLDDREFVLQLAAAEAGLLQARSLIGLKPGDPVSKLDPLNAPPVREAKATLDEATNRRERWQRLRQQNAVAEEELQTLVAAEKVAEARYASALNGVNSNIAQVAVRSAEVDLAKQHIRDADILAPFAGYVQQRLVSVGTYVQIGSPLVTIVRIDSLRFRGTVPERLATELEVGQRVVLTIESVEAPVEAKVTRISPALDMASRSLTFEAQVENRDGALRAGLFAEAEVTIDPTAKSLVIESASLVEFAGAQKVWKVVDGQAKEQKVEPGGRRNGLVEIVSGLEPGDQIIVNGALGRVAQVIPEDQSAAGKPVADKPSADKPVAAKADADKPSAVSSTTYTAAPGRTDESAKSPPSQAASKAASQADGTAAEAITVPAPTGERDAPAAAKNSQDAPATATQNAG